MITPSDFISESKGYGIKLNYDGKNTTIIEQAHFFIDKVESNHVIARHEDDPNGVARKFTYPTLNDTSLYLPCYNDLSCGLRNKDTMYILFPDLARAREFARRLQLIEEIRRSLYKNIWKLETPTLEDIANQIPFS